MRGAGSAIVSARKPTARRVRAAPRGRRAASPVDYPSCRACTLGRRSESIAAHGRRHDGRRVLETSHPPTYYVPIADIAPGVLEPSAVGGPCASGRAPRRTSTWSSQRRRGRARSAGRSRADARLRGARTPVAFYARSLDECWVDDERIVPQRAPSTAAGSRATSSARSRARPGRSAGRRHSARSRAVAEHR